MLNHPPLLDGSETHALFRYATFGNSAFFIEVTKKVEVVYITFNCSSDSVERAFNILEMIPGRATGAYSHSQARKKDIFYPKSYV